MLACAKMLKVPLDVQQAFPRDFFADVVIVAPCVEEAMKFELSVRSTCIEIMDL